MRKLFLVPAAFALLAACNMTDTKSAAGQSDAARKDTVALTTIEWEKSQIDYGKIPEGQKLDVEYHFTNAGNVPLIIQRAEPGCGCTVAETPKEPIAPGKKGVIKGSFDSNGRPGVQHKSIYVYSNAQGSPQELVFTVEVTKKG